MSQLSQDAEHSQPLNVDDFPGGLPACLEAILISADQPQELENLSELLACDRQSVLEALQVLQEGYRQPTHGFELRQTARGWQFASKADYQKVVQTYIVDGHSANLSQAALEALAIIAYRQPITRSQIGQIRGVNSDSVLRSLLVKGLVRQEGEDPDTRAALLVTTDLFLEKMGLNSLEDLPSLAPFLPDEQAAVSQLAQEASLRSQPQEPGADPDAYENQD